jgi:hypothetical protein
MAASEQDEQAWRWDDPTEIADLAAGNWKHQWPHGIEQSDVPTSSDDTNWHLWWFGHDREDIMGASNTNAIYKLLAKFGKAGVNLVWWNRGEMNGLLVKVYVERGGKPSRTTLTDAFKAVCDIRHRLSQYSVLDDTDYSQRVYDDTIENICTELQRNDLLYYCYWAPPVEDANNPVGHVLKCAKALWEWFRENDEKQLEEVDDGGAWPDEEAITKAILAMGWTNWLRVAVEQCVWWEFAQDPHNHDIPTMLLDIEHWLQQHRPTATGQLMKPYPPRAEDVETIREAMAYLGWLSEEHMQAEEHQYWHRIRVANAQAAEGVRQMALVEQSGDIRWGTPVAQLWHAWKEGEAYKPSDLGGPF